LSVLPVGFGSAVAGGYQIERSLRFNSADSTYLSETFGTPTNNRIWTWSGWVKRSLLGSAVFGHLFSHYTSATANNYFYFAGDTLYYGFDNGTVYALTTSAVFRDPSAWYHIMLVMDTTQATASERTKIYVNAIQQTVTGSYVPQNTDTYLNRSGRNVTIGRRSAAADQYFNGYLTEINFIDGQALTPSSFGETDTNTGVWEPKAYTGTYGNNGFYLKFADNSGTTSTTLGVDSSGNGNNWTPSGFSVTAGAGNDSLVDSPTNYGTDTGVGGEVRGNYCTLNPLASWNDANSAIVNGNLNVPTLVNGRGGIANFGVSSGKWYWEFSVTAIASGLNIGIATSSTYPFGINPFILGVRSTEYAYRDGGNKINNNSATAYGASYTTNDVIGVALDLDAGTLVFYKNGVSQGTAYSGLSGSFNPAYSCNAVAATSGFVANFGQRAFAYTAPSGFKALCTTNLPTPTIGATSTTQANDYFNIKTYTGTGTQQSLTGVGFQPDFIWFKSRSTVANHALIDAVRGRNKLLFSSLTDAEATSTTTAKDLVSFDADGFTVGVPEQSGSINTNGTTNVAWNWKANGAGSSNTAGSITSTVSANTTSGFSIVTWTGTGSAATVGHGLGVAPSMIIVKVRNKSGDNWGVYHSSIGNTGGLLLNLTNATGTNIGYWNNTSPTSSVFSVGSFFNTAFDYVAYCFAPVADYSAFGSYTGNGSTDGPFVYTNFRPEFVMIKCSSAGSTFWVIQDGARSPSNAAPQRLFPNASDAEVATSVGDIDILSNGFKIRNTSGSWNTSAATYIYAAFAESPFKYALAR